MSAGWVSGSVRGRLLASRRLGLAGAREVAASGGAAAGVARLAASPYGRDVRSGMAPDAARRGIGTVALWHLRVLAGWLPPRAGDVVRVFGARFELANVADRLAALEGFPVPPPYELGALAVAWPLVAGAADAGEVRRALAVSPWGDPGSAEWPPAALALEARWTSWLAGAVPGAAEWAAGAAAIVAARRLVAGPAAGPAGLADLRRQLGRAWEGATSLGDLAARLPRAAAWALDGVDEAADLWRAEGRWWARVDRDAAGTLRAGRPGPAVAGAAAARLAADAWRARAALEAASWGPEGLEAFDAVA
ncbi:MAG TPA: hypothetical protein VFJ85_04650 [Acidimicrobiales bacterium]|nr:hypothetical protein [Acidimicrobiales bacterium]